MRNGMGMGMAVGGGGAPAEWTPASLPAINAWFDAYDDSTITKDGSNRVTEWRDKITGSTKKYTAAEATAPIHASGILTFDGSKFMTREHGLTSDNTNVTMLFVAKPSAFDTGGFQHFWGHAGSGSMTGYIESTGNKVTLNGGAFIRQNTTASTLLGNYHAYEFNHIPAGGSRVSVYSLVGGSDLSTSGSSGERTFNSANALYLGSNTAPALFFMGTIKCVISVLGTIGVEDWALLKAWLISYYGAAK